MNVKKVFMMVVCVLAALHLQAAQVMVFAAASLTDSLKQIAADYEKSSGDTIVFNFAASGVLARQIEAGAPADIFFSADERQMDAVAAKGLLVPESRRNLLGNSLVIVTAPDNTTIHSATDLTNAAVQRIALGDWKSAPAGTYAKAYLEKNGCWPAVKPKVVQSENVRAVLAAVESGNVDAGIVYKTDAAISKKVKVAYEVPAADGPEIVYPVTLVKDSPQPDVAGKFLQYLASESAAKVFRQFGFIVLEPSSSARPIRVAQSGSMPATPTANPEGNLCKTGAPSTASARTGWFSQQAEAVLGAPDASSVRFAELSKGIASSSPGLASPRAYPGFHGAWDLNPERVASASPCVGGLQINCHAL